MKVVAILPVLTILLGTISAQTPAAKPGTVDGIATNSLTGEPVKNVAVTLQRMPAPNTITATQGASPAAMTDASGHFHFANVEPGSYLLTEEREGFIPARSRQPQLSSQIAVAEDQHVQDVTIKLVPLGVVSGHVLDEDGDPIARAQVMVMRYSYGRRKLLNQAAFTQTNDLGEFEALNLPPGRYYFQVTVPPPGNIPPHTRWVHQEEAYPITFYPNAREVGQATATDVAPGAHVSNIDFHLRKIPAFHIRGTVARATLASDFGRVMIQTSESPFLGMVAQANLQKDGSFDVQSIATGSYQISYMLFARTNASPSNSYQTVQVSDSDVNGVLLTPRPAVDVSGTVTEEGSQLERQAIQISLMARHSMGGVDAPVDADGRFIIRGVAPEICDLQIDNVPDGKYVKSIRFGDLEIKGGEIDLTEGVNAPLNLVLGSDGGEVDGNVQNASGQPAGDTQVTIAPAGDYVDRIDLFKRTSTDASGNFQIKGVAPGEYKVFAWEEDEDGSTQSAEFRKPFESKAAAVTVGTKDKAAVQITVITADDIERERNKLP